MTSSMGKKGPLERHYAISLDGTVMTFECRAGHFYKLDLAKGKRPSQVPATWWLKRMRVYWSRGHAGCEANRWDCPKCRRADKREEKP